MKGGFRKSGNNVSVALAHRSAQTSTRGLSRPLVSALVGANVAAFVEGGNLRLRYRGGEGVLPNPKANLKKKL